jgi:hypothetical protein
MEYFKTSFRVSTDIANLATTFQRSFFSEKYDYDEIIVQKSLFDQSMIKYHYLETGDISAIMEVYSTVISETDSHDNDICFQSAKVEILRMIDKEIRQKFRKN